MIQGELIRERERQRLKPDKWSKGISKTFYHRDSVARTSVYRTPGTPQEGVGFTF